MIFVHYIFIDIRHTISANTSVSNTCGLWNLLKKELITATEKGRFETIVHILKASNILQSWLKELQLTTNLYTHELDYVLKVLLQNLNSGLCQQKDIIFECLMHIITHNESNKNLIQKILILPFMDIEIPVNIVNSHVKEIAKSLNTATMLKCLEVLCEHGNGIERLKVLNTCIIGHQSEIAAGAVL